MSKSPLQTAPLGIAGNTAQIFIHSPLSPLFFLAMLAMGILGLIATPRQEDPQISVPMIDIFLQYPGASSQQVADLAIDPLERLMSEIPGVKHVYSASQREQGVITVQFEVGEVIGPSLVKVHDKISSNLDKMPPGVQSPLVKGKGIDDVPVVNLTLWSPQMDNATLRKLALNVLQNLKQIPNTGQGFIVGGQAEQLRVEVIPERLSGYHLSLDQVANTIRSANYESSVGHTINNNVHYPLYAGGFLRDAEDVAQLVIGTQDGKPIYIRDIAHVTQQPEDPSQLVSYYTGAAYTQAYGRDLHADGEPAVTIALAKKIGTNGVAVANAIIEQANALKGRLIPDDVNIEVTRNYGATANDKVNELLFKLFVATGIVTVLVWFSLGFRPALVVTLIIPVVILMTVFVAFIMGFSIDRVSLFALIFSIGILVDDAIVVVENIYRRWLMAGVTSTEVAVDAVREVGNPTVIATFTVVAALLPMAFVSGLMGPYMSPIPALGSAAMVISLFAAFAFTPWLIMRMKPSLEALHRAEKAEHASNQRLGKLFDILLKPLLEHAFLRFLFKLSLWGILFASCYLIYNTTVTVKMLPYDNKPEFSVILDMPEGTALTMTNNTAREMADMLRKLPEVTAVQVYAGTAKPFDFNGMVRHYYLRHEPWQGELQVQLLHKTKRKRSSHALALQARELLLPIAQRAQARITVAEMPPGPPVLQAVVAEIYGPDDATRRQVAAEMTALFQRNENLADVDNYMAQPYSIMRFKIDTQKAVHRGVSVDTIVRNLGMALGGQAVSDLKVGSTLEPTALVVQIPLEIRADLQRLSDLPIPTQAGQVIPLAELGRFITVEQDPIIYHKDLRSVEYVVGDAVGRLGAPIYPMLAIDQALKAYKTPDGQVLSGELMGAPPDLGQSAFEWGGEWTVTYETFRDMGLAFGVALILIYILVVGMFRDFVAPRIIMAPIPLTLVGIIPGHWLMHAEFSATSMIGFIALAGIIVRNSILLVDFTIEELRQGATIQAAVLESCKARTRPILITAFALVGGSSVILSDPIFQGMAVSLLFGVLISTLLTLIVIPMGCLKAERNLRQIAADRDAEVQ